MSEVQGFVKFAIMASGFVKSNKMRTESKKSNSRWDSHVSSKNSKWLQENLEEMDQHIKRMLKLVEEDADSFAKKADLYFKKRPELISLVEEFYRMYRLLAERYDHVTGELRKSIPSDLQSQGSGTSDVGSELPWTMPSPDQRSSRKSGPRAAGFDIFLGSGSDLNSKEGDETSTTLDSDSDSDDSSVNNYSSTRTNGEEQGLRRRVIEQEGELRELKEKLRVQQQEISEGFKKSNYENSVVYSKITAYEEELRVTREKIRLYEKEIAHLTVELQRYKSAEDSNNRLSESGLKGNDSRVFDSSTAGEPNKVRELQESSDVSEANVSDPLHRIQTLEQELRVTQRKLQESKEEVASLRQELTSKCNSVQKLQDQLKSAEKEVSVWKNRLDKEKKEVLKLQDRIARYKANLADRDQEIRGLKEAMSNANKSLSEENERLQAQMTRMTKERAYLEDNLKELDLRCQSLEEEVRRVRAAKDEMAVIFEAQIKQLMADIAERDNNIKELSSRLEELKLKYEMLVAVKDDLNARIAALAVEMSSKDDQIAQTSNQLHQLQTEQDELVARAEAACELANEQSSRVKELEAETERKQEIIIEGAEGKREAIRQLCLSLEYYRSEYHQLRQAVTAHRRPAVTAR